MIGFHFPLTPPILMLLTEKVGEASDWNQPFSGRDHQAPAACGGRKPAGHSAEIPDLIRLSSHFC